jgi:transposase
LANAFKKAIKQAQWQHLLLAVDVNESWTSKVGSTSGQRTLDNLRLDHHKVSSKLHSVVVCSVCHKLWQRDINASRNIRSRALLQVFGIIPQVFTTFSSG